jgi:hypothetical protein
MKPFLTNGQLHRLIVNTVIFAANKLLQNMGNYYSSTSLITKYTNDFELVIRVSKELEHILTTHCNAQGKGLHEYTSSALINQKPLPPDVVKQLRYLATLRNKLIHEKDFNSIPDRDSFILAFQQTEQELSKLIADANSKAGGGGSACIIA